MSSGEQSGKFWAAVFISVAARPFLLRQKGCDAKIKLV